MSDDIKIFDFGLRLKELRDQKGLTQLQVAEFVGKEVHSIGRYENNTQNPSNETLVRLAILFNTSVDYILGVQDRAYMYIDDLPDYEQKMALSILDTIRREHLKKADD